MDKWMYEQMNEQKKQDLEVGAPPKNMFWLGWDGFVCLIVLLVIPTILIYEMYSIAC